MFGVGPMELVIILVFAVIFIGPKRLPEVMKQMGRFFVQARRYSGEAREAFQGFVRDAELDIQKEEAAKLRQQFDIAGQVREQIDHIKGDFEGDDHGAEFFKGDPAEPPPPAEPKKEPQPAEAVSKEDK